MFALEFQEMADILERTYLAARDARDQANEQVKERWKAMMAAVYGT